jgi:UDP-glucose 4-epimerase
MKKTYIIGGGGFIGKNLANYLAKNNRQVFVVGKYKSKPNQLFKNIEYVCNNCSKEKSLINILKNADEIINLAYNSVPQKSFEDPIADIRNNLPFSLNILNAAYQTKVEKFINVSSGGAVYGNTKQKLISENHKTQPISPYGVSKLAVENYTHMFNFIRKLPAITVRPSNAYGRWQKPFSGQGLISTTFASVLESKQVNIYGKNTIRDYIFIQDLVEAILACLTKGKIGATYNLGSQRGISNIEVIDHIKSMVNKSGFSMKTRIFEPRAFDVPRNVLDCQNIYKDTGWKAKTSFEKGLEITWDWFIKNQKSK